MWAQDFASPIFAWWYICMIVVRIRDAEDYVSGSLDDDCVGKRWNLLYNKRCNLDGILLSPFLSQRTQHWSCLELFVVSLR
jgi:hypothetical protein